MSKSTSTSLLDEQTAREHGGQVSINATAFEPMTELRTPDAGKRKFLSRIPEVSRVHEAEQGSIPASRAVPRHLSIYDPGR